MDKEPEIPEEHETLVILTRLAEHLRKQYLPLPVNGQKVIPKWMAKAADSIEQYLNNLDVKSLDAAFGLEPGHDQPSKPGPKPDIKKELAISTEYIRTREYRVLRYFNAVLRWP